ncbi:MAG: ABC transporter permease [Deltaproteobacteria bacterium]|nr:ABC transporter permease [Deltaproteobacteria bacterium]
MTILRIAWRNLWRNPRRTGITIFSMSFGLTMMIVTYALMDGMYGQMVQFATILGTGHIQIHKPGYLDDRSLYETIDDPAKVLRVVDAAGEGHAAPRTYATALVSSGPQSAGGYIWGIDPLRERQVTDFQHHLASGAFLSEGEKGKVVLGHNLARTLSVGPGDEVVLLAQAADGSLGNAVFRISGVLQSIGETFDRTGVLMESDDMDELMALHGRIHEVAVRLTRPDRLTEALTRYKTLMAPMGLEVKSWRELLPELSEVLKLSSTSTTIVLFIIFAVASLGIVNTQLMSLFERTREIGVMRALGLGPIPVAVIVFLETIFMALISAIAGGAGGALWSWYLEVHGWDISNLGGSFAYAGVTFDPHLRASLTPPAVIQSIEIMLVVCVLATLFPLFKATRITPASAVGRGH